MPQPHGTFLRIQGKGKLAQAAKDDKSTLSTAQAKQRSAFYKALDAYSESELQKWLKQFQKLKARITKQQRDAAQDEDEDLKVEVRIVRHIKELLTKGQDTSEFMATMGKDAKVVIRATPKDTLSAWDVGLVIAVLGVVEVLLRLRKSK